MFFPLSKLLGFFAIPSNLVVSVGILGLLLLPTRFARAGRVLAFASLIVLAILGLSPAGNALILPLEERFPRWDATRGAPDGIIVLGGAISPDVSPGAHHARGSVAQYGRERGFFQGHRPAQAGRTLAAGDVGPSPAAGGRRLPQGGLSGRSLPGRLAHARSR